MLPYLPLGPFLLQLPGLALLIGVWLGAGLAEKEAGRLAEARPGLAHLPAALYNLILVGLVAGLAGARLAYAARSFDAYLANPLSLFALTPVTLLPGAGMLAGIGAALWYGRRRRLPLRPTLDALAPGLAAFLVALGAAHFLSGDAFGAPAYAPDGRAPLAWAIYLWDEHRHPTQIYETAAALAVLAAARRRPFGLDGRGLNFLVVAALSAAARIFIEAFRGDSEILAGGWRAAQLAGMLVLGGALWAMRVWSRPNENTSGKIDSPDRL